MALTKRLLRSPLVLALVRPMLQAYGLLVFGGLRYEHDPRLLRLLRSDEPVLFAVWHQDFVYTLGYLARFSRGRRTYALASASRDGGLAAAAATAQGFLAPVRGSTARGGAQALLGLERRLRADRSASLVIVCDGPRPPARVLKPGIVHLARKTGRPIWLLRSSFARRHQLERTWARFQVPALGTRGVVRADGPIHVPRAAGRDALEAIRRDVEARLNGLADRADARARALA